MVLKLNAKLTVFRQVSFAKVSTSLPSRMKLFVYFEEVLSVNMRIYFRCCDVGMTEEFLHDAEVCAALEQVRCE